MLPLYLFLTHFLPLDFDSLFLELSNVLYLDHIIFTIFKVFCVVLLFSNLLFLFFLLVVNQPCSIKCLAIISVYFLCFFYYFYKSVLFFSSVTKQNSHLLKYIFAAVIQ